MDSQKQFFKGLACKFLLTNVTADNNLAEIEFQKRKNQKTGKLEKMHIV